MCTWLVDPGKMNLFLIFVCLQATLRVTFVFSSAPIDNNSTYLVDNDTSDKFEDEDGWGLPSSSAKMDVTFGSPTSILCGPVSPVPFTETIVGDDVKITKEWIENYLIPTFQAGRMIPTKLVQKVSAVKLEYDLTLFLDY